MTCLIRNPVTCQGDLLVMFDHILNDSNWLYNPKLGSTRNFTIYWPVFCLLKTWSPYKCWCQCIHNPVVQLWIVRLHHWWCSLNEFHRVSVPLHWWLCGQNMEYQGTSTWTKTTYGQWKLRGVTQVPFGTEGLPSPAAGSVELSSSSL